MKHLLTTLFLLAQLALPFAPAHAAPQAYALDRAASSVGFAWYLGKDRIEGQMPVAEAQITLDLDRLPNSRVRVALDVVRAKAGFPFASEGMKSRKMLWAKRHPQIVFESTGFRRVNGATLVDGNLTIRGVTRPATFTARLFRQAGSEAGDHSYLDVRLEGRVSRAAFGADGWKDLAGDAVELSIRASLKRRG